MLTESTSYYLWRSSKQNVALAVQLMSNTTAIAIKRYLLDPNNQLAENVADFIDIINHGFDIMNLYTSAEPN